MIRRPMIRPARPATSKSGRTRATLGLTADVMHDVRPRVRRLGLGGMVVTTAIGVPWVFVNLFSDTPGTRFMPLIALVGLVMGAVVWGVARTERFTEGQVLFVGIAFLVIGCGVSGVIHATYEFNRFGHLTPFGPYVIFICGAPLILVTPPRFTLWLCGFSSLAVLLGLQGAEWAGHAEVSTSELFEVSGILLACSALAYVTNRTMFGLHREVARARRLGSYELLEQVGAGGMGEVWRARHDMLARPAAVKLIQPERLGDDLDAQQSAVSRFAREAQATATLESPHTVRLFDFGQTDDGTFYYAMELLDGVDLEQLVFADGPQSPERVQHILRQACDSIAEAHDLGLVHRDIKPGNIMVCRKGRAYDFVKVLDFGLVTLQEQVRLDSDPEARLTQLGQVVGTPGFMAPESLVGAPNDQRSDIYALGCLAFWLLTGRRVFEGPGYREVAMAHLGQVAPRVGTLVRVPRELDALIADCLARDADGRPDNLDVMIERLDAVPFPRPWDQARASRWWSEAEAMDLRRPRRRPDPVGEANTVDERPRAAEARPS